MLSVSQARVRSLCHDHKISCLNFLETKVHASGIMDFCVFLIFTWFSVM